MTPALIFLALAFSAAEPARPFAISVVDEQTGRGVPLVELKTVNEIRYVTDSAGVVAFSEPGLMNRPVFFHVKSHGYEHAKDGFGFRGKALTPTEGGIATLKVRRLNVAERLYRVTGAGVYRDSVLTGRDAPVREPVLNAQVMGQDSVLMTRYRGKLYWFWGDTNRPDYPLGNFHSPGAISDPPRQGGLDPEAGVNLTYFVDKDGFARPTAQFPGDGPTWLGGLASFVDDSGVERLVAGYAKIRPPMETYEQGLAEFDPETNRFQKVATFPLDAPSPLCGHTYLRKEGNVEFLYYANPFPLRRVRARMADLTDPARYESFTCLEAGTRLDHPKLDRDPDGKLRYAWRADTPAVGPAEQAKLIKDGVIKADEALIALRDVETGKPIQAHYGSVYWNEYRKRWVLIDCEAGGSSSFLGEVWFAEADTPVGPWVYARKVVTHDKYSFYNPKQHPELAKDHGRVIFFEGTYTATFSGNPEPTPRYDYNQVMYKLDLSDPRLNLPVPVYRSDEKTYATGPDAARGERPRFFAMEKAGPGTVEVRTGPKGEVVCHALDLKTKNPPQGTVMLYKVSDPDGPSLVPSADRPPGGEPIGLVWPAPTSVQLSAAR